MVKAFMTMYLWCVCVFFFTVTLLITIHWSLLFYEKLLFSYLSKIYTCLPDENKTFGIHSYSCWKLKVLNRAVWKKTEWPSNIFPFHVLLSPIGAAVDAVYRRRSKKRARMERAGEPSVSSVAILEKTIKLLKQWGLCKDASISPWLFLFPNTLGLHVKRQWTSERSGCGITAGWVWWKRTDRCWQKAQDNKFQIFALWGCKSLHEILLKIWTDENEMSMTSLLFYWWAQRKKKGYLICWNTWGGTTFKGPALSVQRVSV